VLARIESLVKSAIGFDASRGDSLTVDNIAFHVPDETLEKALASSEFSRNIQGYMEQILPYFVAAMFFFLLIRPLVKHILTPPEAEVDLGRLLPSGISELEAELEQERSKAKIPTFEPVVDLEQLEELMAENSRIVKESPHQAALLIRYWLNDGRL
jgi:flagellar M-ring protein FliF